MVLSWRTDRRSFELKIALSTAMFIILPCWGQFKPPSVITGLAKGTVTDKNSAPVAGARIFIAQALATAAKAPPNTPFLTGPLVTSVVSGKAGEFTAANLPVGNYVAFAQPPKPGLLDPCHWSASAPTFAVASGKLNTGVAIAMAAGAVVPIRINDPHQLLQGPNGAHAPDYQCSWLPRTDSAIRRS